MMKHWFAIAVLFSLTSFFPLMLHGQQVAPPAASPAVDESAHLVATDQIILKYRATADLSGQRAPDQAERLDLLSQAAGVSLQYVRPMSGDAHVLKLPQRLSPAEVKEIVVNLMSLADIEYAEPDAIKWIDGAPNRPEVITQPELAPNDPDYADQWHYKYTAGTAEGLNLPQAWDITTGSSSIVVAVIDTGILNHADLAGRTVPGYDFISDVFTANDGNGRDGNPADPGDWVEAGECGAIFPQDSSWHGTHVAGTIGAASNNSLGVAGVNWQSKILPVRVLGKCGGSTSDIVDAMRWSAGLSVPGVPANANPAKVLNLSLGGPGACSITEQNAINQIIAAGSTVVVAAGNSNDNAAGYTPASCNGVITVAATNRTGSRSSYSNYGSVVEVSAPGGETFPFNEDGVLSTLNNGTTIPGSDAYVFYQGTSMAAPHVSGLASLILSLKPGYSPAQVLQQLENTARPFPGGSTCNTNICGEGIVDAYQTLLPLSVTPDHEIYLPTVLRVNVAPPPPPPSSLINPGFESGPTGWTEYSENGWDIILSTADLPVAPHAGSWAAWLGGGDDEIAYIQQQVTVPAGSPYLAYWHWIYSEDLCGYDYGKVVINGATVDTYDLCESSSTGAWQKHVVNLSAYAGQSVALQLRAETDFSAFSSLYIDDVAFQATPALAGDEAPAAAQVNPVAKPEKLGPAE
jgi:subtilisin family serine protease